MSDAFNLLQTYNGMDTIATFELFEKLRPQLDGDRLIIYNRSLALQAPALEMMLTGLLLNPTALQQVIRDAEANEQILLANWATLTSPFLSPPPSISSTHQLKNFFYKILNYPEIKISKKGESKVSVDAEALEKLQLLHPETTPYVKTILAYRVIQTRFRVYRSGHDRDLRMRCSYSIAGTTTGRWSSSQNAFHGGTNLQNIPGDARHIFVADAGKKFAYIDLEQAESRGTGLYAFAASGLTNYLDACDAGDLHTSVAKMVWPDLEWTGDLARDRELAELPYYREYDRRFMCKKVGHGTNYYGKPFTISRQARIPTNLVKEFQTLYYAAFPEIDLYQRHTIRNLQLNKRLTTLLNRVRHFFGRTTDDGTFREAIAFLPQSLVGDVLNLAILQIFSANIVQLLAQIHDAIIIQYPENREDEILSKVVPLMGIPLTATHTYPPSPFLPSFSRSVTHIIPSSVEVGWNWGKFSPKNPDGLKKWKMGDDRQRIYNPEMSILDRPVL